MVDYKALEKIKTRIDNISIEMRALRKSDPKSENLSALSWKLRVNIEAYKLNVWLSWRHLDNYPYAGTKIDLVLSSFSAGDNKNY